MVDPHFVARAFTSEHFSPSFVNFFVNNIEEYVVYFTPLKTILDKNQFQKSKSKRSTRL